MKMLSSFFEKATLKMWWDSMKTVFAGVKFYKICRQNNFTSCVSYDSKNWNLLFHRRMQKPEKYLRWIFFGKIFTGFQPLVFFTKSSIFDVDRFLIRLCNLYIFFGFSHPSFLQVMSNQKCNLITFDISLIKQKVQGLQAFAFSVVTVNDEHTKPRLKKIVRVKFKECIFTQLCLKPWFESDWYFCSVPRSAWFSKRLSKKKVLNNHFLKSLQKQLYAVVLQKRCSKKFRNIHRKTSVLESLFNKVAACNFM